jgi:hypothetical protein
MHKTDKMEEFSRAYICALAARLGYNWSRPSVDMESIDITFNAAFPNTSIRRSPQINFQLKCTGLSFHKDGYLHFPLKVKNYNDLLGANRANPFYLVVVCVPEDEKEWVEEKPEEMILKYSAYWISLKDEKETRNTTSVTIKIPKHQKFDINIFEMLMVNASQGIAL